jgi:hypothetical protein
MIGISPSSHQTCIRFHAIRLGWFWTEMEGEFPLGILAFSTLVRFIL